MELTRDDIVMSDEEAEKKERGEKGSKQKVIVLPLYSQLSPEKQYRVF